MCIVTNQETLYACGCRRDFLCKIEVCPKGDTVYCGYTCETTAELITYACFPARCNNCDP